jgi:hypothetical protein
MLWTVARRKWKVRKKMKDSQRKNLKREIILMHRNMLEKYGKR